MTGRAVLLLLAFAAGAALALAAMPWLVSRVHNDSSELCAIVRALPRERAAVAVFGNSTGQAAIDLDGIANFCSSEQTLAESLLLQQELPASTKTIVQVVASWQAERTTPFEPDHLSMLKMCGWRVAPATRAAFARAFGEDRATDLDSHPIRDRFAARSHLRAALEIFVRERIRRPAGAPRYGGSGGAPVLQAEQIRILEEAAAAARASGRRYVVVLAPLRASNPPFVAAMQRLDAEVIDLTQFLPAEEFADATHANAAGRKRVGEALRPRLQ